jgi:hypothetical protein
MNFLWKTLIYPQIPQIPQIFAAGKPVLPLRKSASSADEKHPRLI